MDFRSQRSVDWALLGDLKKTRPLSVGKRSGQDDFPFDLVQQFFFGFAICAVGCVNPRMFESNGHTLEGPLLSTCI
jgi:hypothetical protein